MESQALKPEGKGLPLEAAKPTRRNPAGMRRNAETKNGPHFGSTSFMATMAVPQKKNGDTSTANSQSPSARHSIVAGDDSSSCFALPSCCSKLTVHSAFCPVPTQSTSVPEGGGLLAFTVDLLEHGSLNRSEDGGEGGNGLVWNWEV